MRRIEKTKPKLNYNINSLIQEPKGHYWANAYSVMKVNGSIEKCVLENLKRYNNVSWVCVSSDGIFDDKEYEKTTKWCIHSQSHMKNVFITKCVKNTKHLIGLLCCRFINPEPYLLLPLDDEIFSQGLLPLLSSIPNCSWESKISKAVWRGSTTAGFPSIRTQTASLLWDDPNTDLKLVYSDEWSRNMPIPKNHFGDRYDIAKQFQYKYIFIIDGAAIASNHMWVFGSGSVPIMITHPSNEYWFKKYLKPMENYVPIKYDLSDVKEKINWLISNDEQAKKIMENAIELSRTLFSHQGQVEYIQKEMNRLL